MRPGQTRTQAVFAFCLLAATIAAAQGRLVVDDPLTTGTTVGARDNGPGQFISGGWRVTGASDNIRYTPEIPIEVGAIEFDVTGLRFDDTREQNHRGQILSMYDASFGDPRHVYAPDIRLNPFKFVLQRNGRDEEGYFANYLKFIMNTDGVNQFEDYSSVGPFPWDESRTYRMRLEWKDGVIRFFIDGRDIDRWPFVYRSTYRPAVHDIRIGTNTRNNAILDARYSNVKIYDFGTPPAPPFINNPKTTVRTLVPILDWAGGHHTQYEARITGSPDPDAAIVWDSGLVPSANAYARSDPLSDNTTYFAHVRLKNALGWGEWSVPKRFQTLTGDAAIVPTYTEHELVFLATTARDNPYTDVSVTATFEGPTRTIRIDGLWDGGALYKVRVLPTEPGLWSWRVSSNDPSLDGKAGTFVAEASTSKGYVRVATTLPYTFEWAGTGEPFFFLGDTIWHMYYNLRFLDGTFQRLIDDRAAQHFNYAHGVVHDFLGSESGPIYRVQDHGREMFDTDWLNPDYFHLIDHKIDYMNARGMAAGLFFSWGNEGYQEYETQEQYARYIRYLVSRYASKNVFWIIVGEFEEAGEPRSRWRDYMSTVAEADPYGHPTSLHTVVTTDAFGADPEHSFISHQRKGTPEELRALVANSRIFDKPVINLEYGYEGDPRVFPANQAPHLVRRDHYALTLAGGYAVYGNHTPWYSTYHRVGDFVLEATDTPGAEYLAILYEFFDGTSFHRLEPAQGLVDRGIAAAWQGQEYVVQLPTGGDVRLDLSAASGHFVADWFNPRTGERTRIGSVSGGSRWSFRAPNTDDWLLHLVSDGPSGGGIARIDLGPSDFEEGLFLVEPADGTSSPRSIGGREAKENTDPGSDFFFYFDVNDAFHFEGGHPSTAVTIDYFDSGTGSLTIQYDASDGARYKNGGTVVPADTGLWKSHTFHLGDAWFGNRQNGGADFRIFGGVGNRFHIDTVEVTHEAPGRPGVASSPDPVNQATDTPLDVIPSWAPGSGATSHDVYFGTANPPAFRGRQAAATFVPGPLAPSTTYFWLVDEVNASGVTPGALWSFTTADGETTSTLEILPTAGLRIDGMPDDWDLSTFGRTVRAGELATGDVALVGYDGGTLHVSGHVTSMVLPESARDHTARVYAQHDAESLYFLARVDDDDLRATHGVGMNWANDCIEIYIDPSADGGPDRMQGSVSDIQLVIDVTNQANVYVAESSYRDRVLGGLVSAVTSDADGWWIEVKLLKSSLSPKIPLEGVIGLDFNFRDNDADNAPSQSTVYTWSDFERSANFPSKIPDRWARARLLELPAGGPPSAAENPMPIDGARDVGLEPRLAWEGGLGASSYRVHFGVNNPPSFVSTTLPASFDPGPLVSDTTYHWRVDAVNAAGTAVGPTWSFTTGVEVLTPALRIHRTASVVIDGSPSDWNLDEHTALARAGDVVEGDIALVGYDGGTLHWAGRATQVSLPASLADHTARVYARHDDTFLYFLVWLSDDDVQTPFDAAMNWANDSLEIYLDPSADGGTGRLESSASDVQLVIDARNQTNVYVTTPTYRAQVLAGVESAVSSHASGWWCELRIDMNVLDPDPAGSGSFGLDFNFRDNDGGNDRGRTTVYTWSDTEQSGNFPSKIPNRWGRGRFVTP